MNHKEQIQLIQKVTGLNQDEIANKLGVTFAALNRWLNDKAIPRESIKKKINKLYIEATGEDQRFETLQEAKINILKNKQKKHKNVLKEILSNPDIKDQFVLSLTYNSNSIEGSTLSENETAGIIFHNKTFPSKSMIEHLEAKNHQTVLEYLFGYLLDKGHISEKLILKLHEILMNGIHSDAGFYRSHGVRIVGSNVPTANYVKIPQLMEELAKDIDKRVKNVINYVASIHSRFEQIHPFGDGNGRIGRLIMNAMLLKENFALAVIRQKEKHKYYSCLNTAQLKENIEPLEDFIVDSVLEGYKILERIDK